MPHEHSKGRMSFPQYPPPTYQQSSYTTYKTYEVPQEHQQYQQPPPMQMYGTGGYPGRFAYQNPPPPAPIQQQQQRQRGGMGEGLLAGCRLPAVQDAHV